MSWLATITISNAVVATGLGLFAYIVGRSSRNAALGHVLWVLVLIKLVTPPVFDLPLAVLPEWAVAASTIDVDASSESMAIDLPPAMRDGVDASAASAAVGPTLSSNAISAQPEVATDLESATGLKLPSILLWLFRIWIAGIVFCGLYQIYVTCQMWKLMKMASPDSRIDRAMHRIAHAANVKNYPIARIVPWVGSPMLWGLGGTSVIVLPAQLFESLEDDAADTLMQHELAHFQRGDQWVRILQAVVSTLYWWHPIVWLASRQIEVYEEQCCDGWVVRQDKPNRRRYAEALLDTVDFISDAPDAALPVAASGLGRIPLLEQRLKSIMRGDEPFLSWRGKVAIATLLLILPLQPRLSQARYSLSSLRVADVATEQMTVAELDEAVERESVLEKMKALAAETQTHLRMTPDEKRRAVRSVPGVDYARAISPIGRYELIAKGGRNVRLIDVVANRAFELNSHEIMCAAFSRKRSQFVVGTRQGKVLLYNSENAAVERELGSFNDAVRSVAYSPDGEWLAVGCDWNVVRLIGPKNQRIELMTGSGRDKVFGRRGVSVSSVRFNSNGTKLAVALDTMWRSDSLGLVEIWNVESKSKEQTIVCPSAVGVAGFDEDGHVLTAEWTGEARVWSASSIRGKWFGSKSQQLGVAIVPKDGVSAAAFSQDAIRLEEMVAMHANWSNSRPGVSRRLVQ